MNFLNFDFKKGMILFFFLVLPLFSLNSQRQSGDLGWYDKPFSFIESQLQTAFFAFSDGVRSTTSLYMNLIDMKKDSARINDENLEMKSRLTQYEELLKENGRLSQLLEFKAHSKMSLVAAKVIGRDLVSDHNTIIINRGTSDGLKSGMAVITTEGVVGSVFRPERSSAQVLLITDRFAVVDGVIARSRVRGIVEGFSPQECLLRYVDKSDDIKDGDLIVTSGIDNIFPKGFPVARVGKIENRNYTASLKVQAQPVVDPNHVEEVFVITDAAHEEIHVAEPTTALTGKPEAERVAGAKQ